MSRRRREEVDKNIPFTPENRYSRPYLRSLGSWTKLKRIATKGAWNQCKAP